MTIYRFLYRLSVFACGFFIYQFIIGLSVMNNLHELLAIIIALIVSFICTAFVFIINRFYISPAVTMLYIAMFNTEVFDIACIHGDAPGTNRYFVRVGNGSSFAQVKFDLFQIQTGFITMPTLVSEEFVENEIQQRDRWILQLGNFVFVNTFE